MVDSRFGVMIECPLTESCVTISPLTTSLCDVITVLYNALLILCTLLPQELHCCWGKDGAEEDG